MNEIDEINIWMIVDEWWGIIHAMQKTEALKEYAKHEFHTCRTKSSNYSNPFSNGIKTWQKSDHSNHFTSPFFDFLLTFIRKLSSQHKIHMHTANAQAHSSFIYSCAHCSFIYSCNVDFTINICIKWVSLTLCPLLSTLMGCLSWASSLMISCWNSSLSCSRSTAWSYMDKRFV